MGQRRMNLDIDALVATGPAGVRTILETFNSWQPADGNYHPYARIPRRLKAVPASRALFSWSGIVVANGVPLTTITPKTSTIVPQFGAASAIQVQSLIAVAMNASDIAGGPIVEVWRGARGAPLSAQTVLTGFTVAVTTASTPGARAEFRVTPATPIVLTPGETLTLRCNTNVSGTAAFDTLSAQLYGRVLHGRW